MQPRFFPALVSAALAGATFAPAAAPDLPAAAPPFIEAHRVGSQDGEKAAALEPTHPGCELQDAKHLARRDELRLSAALA